VRQHAAEYGADPSLLVVAGSSAGAHLASMAALTANDSVRFQHVIDGIETLTAWVQARRDPACAQRTTDSPLNRVTSTAEPRRDGLRTGSATDTPAAYTDRGSGR
jgi:acetyl esterase/lipase